MTLDLVPRNMRHRVEEAMEDTPVVAVNGARQVGKSTLVAQLVEDRPAEVVTLDDRTQLHAAREDPVAFVDRPSTLVIDEVQRAPELLPAIKASVDRDRRPGRFVITGSTRLLSTVELGEFLAGRVEIVDLWPLSQGELLGRREGFVDRLFSGAPNSGAADVVTRADYAERICAGGFPEPLARTGRRRAAWFENYATTVVERMVAEVATVDRLAAMPTLLRLCAARTSNELNVADLARDAGLPERTAHDHLAHLERVFLVHRLPAWSRNLTSKVSHRPKVLLPDSGLAAHLLGVDPRRLDKPASPIGQLLETFVTMEVRKQLGWAETGARLFHFRDRQGDEVDLVLEARDGRVAGIEVKAASSVGGDDFRGLRLLRDRLGDQFVGGVVLHRGPDAAPFGDRLHALPLSALWTEDTGVSRRSG